MRLFREDDFATHRDVEDAIIALNESGFHTQTVIQSGGQTGSLRKIVSRHAIGNRDHSVHSSWYLTRFPAV